MDGDALTAAVVAGPSHGTLVLNANGSLSYNPGGQTTTVGQLHYKANDGTADSNVATVSLTVTAVKTPRWRSMTATRRRRTRR